MNAPNPLVVPNDKQKMGKPCKRGHSGLKWKINGGCVECNRERLRIENMTPEQIEAKRKWDRKWYAENPEKVREADRKWRAENPEKVRAQHARQIRMRAGGIQFHLGYAPTVEHAKVFRESLNRLPKGKSW